MWWVGLLVVGLIVFTVTVLCLPLRGEPRRCTASRKRMSGDEGRR